MPIYEYHCERCDQKFEVMQKFSDEPVAVHEGCGGAVERLISSSALQFKGSGWYVTDYAKKNGSAPSKSESKGESKGDSKSDSKSDSGSGKKDTAPAAKSEPSTAKTDKK